MLAKMYSKGEPIVTTSICLYMTPSKLNPTDVVANFISSKKMPSEISVGDNMEASAHISIVSISGTHVKRLEISKVHINVSVDG